MSYQRIRSFISIDIEDPVIVDKIQKIQALLEDKNTKIKFVEPENLHITLRFLGEIYESQIKELITALKIVKKTTFRIHFKYLGAFPSIQRARVIWIGVEKGEEDLKQLSMQVNQIVDKLRIGKKENKKFTPHLTIGRLKTRPSRHFIETITRNSNIDIGEIDVTEFRLKQSILTSRGPIYKTLFSFKLS